MLLLSPSLHIYSQRLPPREWYHPQWVGLLTSIIISKIISQMQAYRLIFHVTLESVELTILTTTMLTLNMNVNLY